MDAEIFVNTCSVEKRMLIQALSVELKRLIDKDPEPEFVTTPSDMRVVGQQKRVATEDGEFIVEWNGLEWFKKYLICQVTKYNATGCWQKEALTPVSVPSPENGLLITPEELMEIVKEGQRIYGGGGIPDHLNKGMLFTSTKTVHEVIEDLEKLRADADEISHGPDIVIEKEYYRGISDGIKWSINRVKNIEQAVKIEVSGDNVTPKVKNMATIPPSGAFRDNVAREAVIEILDMLEEYGNPGKGEEHGVTWNRHVLRERAEALKAKLVGEK